LRKGDGKIIKSTDKENEIHEQTRL
jgi:hypothetical protein